MKCKELESNAIAYLDGKLAPPHREAVEAHLAACPACRERVHGFTRVMGLLDEWPAVQPSPFFQTRLAARLQEEPASRSWWSSLWPERDLRPAAGSIVAVALALVVTVAVAVLRYSPGPLDAAGGGTDLQGVTVTSAGDDLPLYQDLPLLEDYEVLRNFEVLQVLNNPNPGVR
ncbi:MAG: anti-sigma factor family protein [Terriglobia bacterium]